MRKAKLANRDKFLASFFPNDFLTYFEVKVNDFIIVRQIGSKKKVVYAVYSPDKYKNYHAHQPTTHTLDGRKFPIYRSYKHMFGGS